jgi:porphobilinogen synthase
MMDGRTGHLRAALDARGHERVPIASYSTKFARSVLRSFREEALHQRRSSAIAATIRLTCGRGATRSDQCRCARRARTCDGETGHDVIDLIQPIINATGKPVGAYQVSGEYAGMLALANQGLTNFDLALLETWHVFRRAGASYVITYGARHARAIGL